MPTEFTPFTSLLGGGLVGLSAVLLMWTLGRVAGVSGILSRIVTSRGKLSGMWWSVAFLAGLALAVPLYFSVTGTEPEQTIETNFLLLGIAGLFVGFGSVFGSGCTSGHGVCGISRLSARSIVATLTFMATGMLTVTIVRHGFGG